MSAPETDPARIDDAVLALLHLTRFVEKSDMGFARAWKSHDFEVMNRLHAYGMISDPVNNNKSILLTEEGDKCSTVLVYKLFAKRDS
jgi:hypothetical protein